MTVALNWQEDPFGGRWLVADKVNTPADHQKPVDWKPINGVEASQAAQQIAQHAISCPQYLKSALALMHEPETTRPIDPVSLAFLADRVAPYNVP